MGTVRYQTINGEILSEIRGGVRKQYIPDPLGSTVALVDSTGAITDTFEYWPYGEVRTRTGSSVTPFSYQGVNSVYSDGHSRYYTGNAVILSSESRSLSQQNLQFGKNSLPAYSINSNNPTSNYLKGFRDVKFTCDGAPRTFPNEHIGNCTGLAAQNCEFSCGLIGRKVQACCCTISDFTGRCKHGVLGSECFCAPPPQPSPTPVPISQSCVHEAPSNTEPTPFRKWSSITSFLVMFFIVLSALAIGRTIAVAQGNQSKYDKPKGNQSTLIEKKPRNFKKARVEFDYLSTEVLASRLNNLKPGYIKRHIIASPPNKFLIGLVPGQSDMIFDKEINLTVFPSSYSKWVCDGREHVILSLPRLKHYLKFPAPSSFETIWNQKDVYRQLVQDAACLDIVYGSLNQKDFTPKAVKGANEKHMVIVKDNSTVQYKWDYTFNTKTGNLTKAELWLKEKDKSWGIFQAIEFSNWNWNPTVKPDTFKITIPNGWVNKTDEKDN